MKIIILILIKIKKKKLLQVNIFQKLEQEI